MILTSQVLVWFAYEFLGENSLNSLIYGGMVSIGVYPKNGQTTNEKNEIINSINDNKTQYEESALKIWGWAELGYQEYKSAKELQDLLKNEGFSLEIGIANIPTAFVATYKNGDGPVIGILGEYDALPGLSQTNEPKKKLRDGVSSGHACGHNLFGVASAASSIAIKKWMEKTNTKGTIKFFGCPAEEGGSGKVYMVREGYFENVDIVLNWHPSNSNGASAGSSLANKTGKFRFSGVSAHAAGAPQRGRSALDGIEAMNNMLNMMREHVEPESRIHYMSTPSICLSRVYNLLAYSIIWIEYFSLFFYLGLIDCSASSSSYCDGCSISR